jgi:hypothetical protein
MGNKYVSIDELIDIVHELNSRLADESDHEDVLVLKIQKLLDFLYHSKKGGE